MAAKRLSRLVVTHPVMFLVVLVGISLVLAYQAREGLSLKVVLEEMLPVERNNVQLMQKFGEQFGGANTTLIALENQNGDIYNADFLKAYSEFSDELYFYPDTIRHLVQSLSLRKTKAVAGSGGRILIDALMWPRPPESEAARRDRKLSSDGRRTAASASLTLFAVSLMPWMRRGSATISPIRILGRRDW